MSIQPKLKECSVCHQMKVLWIANPKQCKDCAGKAKSSSEGLKRANRLTPKNAQSEKKDVRVGLNVFFASQILIMPDRCQNCDQPLKAFTKFFKRCVTAHILPKSEFTSVAIHPKNVMFLGAIIVGVCDCHDQWDRKGSAHRCDMNCYEIAIKAFNDHLVQCLTDEELVRACKYLRLNFEKYKDANVLFSGITGQDQDGNSQFINIDKYQKP